MDSRPTWSKEQARKVLDERLESMWRQLKRGIEDIKRGDCWNKISNCHATDVALHMSKGRTLQAMSALAANGFKCQVVHKEEYDVVLVMLTQWAGDDDEKTDLPPPVKKNADTEIEQDPILAGLEDASDAEQVVLRHRKSDTKK